MLFQRLSGLCLLALSSVSVADSLSPRKYLWGQDGMGQMVKRAASTTSTAKTSSTSLVADSSCTNGPYTRSCWGSGYSVDTDFDQKHPTTGNTVSYSLSITNTTCNPDGANSQQCFLINGGQVGPTIFAKWGDTISVTVTNNMQNNGTSMHWHGIRQLNTNGMDGVNGVTECPLAPGQSKTYTFLATQYGTSWYHSHYSSQYGMGVVGTIHIDGPATANYDIDLGVFPVSDWYYKNADVVNDLVLDNLQSESGPPAGSNILVNGTAKGNSSGVYNVGSYATVTVTPNKKHRLRLINTSVDNTIKVKLDNHPFEVISADFIPIQPLAGQDWVMLGIGQRYDVIFTANNTAATYWFRAEVATDCLATNIGHGRALFTYTGGSTTAPTDSNELPPSTDCKELTTVPFWSQTVSESTFTSQYKNLNLDFTEEQVTTNGQNLVVWALNTTSIQINWGNPTLEYVMTSNTSYPARYDVIEIPNEGVWTYWVIQNLQTTDEAADEIAPVGNPHPIHLHGHDFFVLGSGSGQFSGSASDLNFATAPRRDTSLLPSGGWLALAFQANNPGAWLMHCHIAWHISEGLGVQFLEAKSQIVLPSSSQFDSQCSNWNTYAKTMAYPQVDSGL